MGSKISWNTLFVIILIFLLKWKNQAFKKSKNILIMTQFPEFQTYYVIKIDLAKRKDVLILLTSLNF